MTQKLFMRRAIVKVSLLAEQGQIELILTIYNDQRLSPWAIT